MACADGPFSSRNASRHALMSAPSTSSPRRRNASRSANLPAAMSAGTSPSAWLEWVRYPSSTISLRGAHSSRRMQPYIPAASTTGGMSTCSSVLYWLSIFCAAAAVIDASPSNLSTMSFAIFSAAGSGHHHPFSPLGSPRSMIGSRGSASGSVGRGVGSGNFGV